MTIKHTPGPWNYGQESIDPEWWIVTLNGGLIVANVNAHFNQEANARLIGAAPDLLAAALQVLNWHAAGCDPSAKSMAALSAAVEKATGAP
jgi:hypothetical protein